MTTTLPDEFLTELTAGFAQWIVSFDIGLDWQPSGLYPDDVTGIFDSAVPPLPDRLVTLTPYPLSYDPTLSQSVIGMQWLTRGATQDPREVRNLDGAIWNRVIGNYPVTLPNGVRVNTIAAGGRTSLGQEDGGARRWRRTSNVVLNTYQPTPHRH